MYYNSQLKSLLAILSLQGMEKTSGVYLSWPLCIKILIAPKSYISNVTLNLLHGLCKSCCAVRLTPQRHSVPVKNCETNSIGLWIKYKVHVAELTGNNASAKRTDGQVSLILQKTETIFLLLIWPICSAMNLRVIVSLLRILARHYSTKKEQSLID